MYQEWNNITKDWTQYKKQYSMDLKTVQNAINKIGYGKLNTFTITYEEFNHFTTPTNIFNESN